MASIQSPINSDTPDAPNAPVVTDDNTANASKLRECIGRYATEESQNMNQLSQLFHCTPIPKHEVVNQLGLFTTRQLMGKMLCLNQIYLEAKPVHGVIMEFGTRFGNNLGIFKSLISIYEPYNFTRELIGFDTFTGFEKDDIVSEDHNAKFTASENTFTTANASNHVDVNTPSLPSLYDGTANASNYDEYLKMVMDCHQRNAPLPHIDRVKIVKGNAITKVADYLIDNPHTIIALAYFDMDLYKPTKECLKTILPYLTKGSVLVFDELCHPWWPGETKAVSEVLGLQNVAIKRTDFAPNVSYIVM